MASGRDCTGVWFGAKRSQLCLRIRHCDESYGSGAVLAIERGWVSNIKYAAVSVRIVGIVKPESKVEGMDRLRIALVRIKTEDLIEQDRLDGCRERAFVVRLNVGLIPSHSKIREGRIRRSVRPEVASLDREHVEGQTGFEVLAHDRQRIVQSAASHVSGGSRRIVARHTQAAKKLWIRVQ